MESTEQVIGFEDIAAATSLTFDFRFLAIQFVGTFLSLAIFYTFSFFSFAMLFSYTVVGACIIIIFGLVISYPLMSATLLVSSTVQKDGFPSKLEPFVALLQLKFLQNIICSFICVVVTSILALPHFILLLIGTAVRGGEVLLALFLIPLMALTVLQLLVLFLGLFVIPQLIASKQGDLADLFQMFRGIVLTGAKHLMVRHTFGLILSILLSLPLWLVVDFSLGALGAMTSAVVSDSPADTKEEAAAKIQPQIPVLPLFPKQLAAFSPVLQKDNHLARFLIGFATVFAFSFPLAIGFLCQSATGLLAIRTLSPSDDYSDYPPPGL